MLCLNIFSVNKHPLFKAIDFSDIFKNQNLTKSINQKAGKEIFVLHYIRIDLKLIVIFTRKHQRMFCMHVVPKTSNGVLFWQENYLPLVKYPLADGFFHWLR